MAVKLRLTRVGKTKQPQYRIVAADSRSPRDGRFIEIVGHYNPRTEPSTLTVDNDKAVKWLRRAPSRPTGCASCWRSPARSSSSAPPSRQRPRTTRERRVDDAVDADDGNRAPLRPPSPCSPTSSRRSSTTPTPSRSTTSESRGRVRLDVRVGPGDLGRVIGRRGRTAQSIRTVVRAAATRDDTDVDVEFLDD